MLSNGRLTAFLATANARRSKAFYRGKLRLRFVSEDKFALLFDCKGVPLRIQKVETLKPHSFTALGWQVRGLRRVMAGLVKRGVVFERYSFLKQDDEGVWLAPSGTRVAWFKDPDGNLLSVSESGSA
jgi:catechol 2,3-dioxygenase-like lactoylglutathione lyase family enzyme